MVIDTYSLATQGQNSFDTYAIATMGYNDLMVDSRFVVDENLKSLLKTKPKFNLLKSINMKSSLKIIDFYA